MNKPLDGQTNDRDDKLYPPHFPTPARANLMLGLLLVAYILSFLDRQIIALMVEPIKRTLLLSDLQIGLLQGLAFAAFYAFGGVLLGRYADRFCRTRLIAGGILLWSLMTVACGFAGSYTTLFLARMGVGVGEAVLSPAGYSLLADSFPAKRLVRATAIYSLGSLLGGSLAFFFGGMLLEYLNAGPSWLLIGSLEPWQMAFVLAGLPALFIVPLFLLMPEPARQGVSSSHAPAFAQTLSYLWNRRRVYAPFYICATLLAVSGYGGLNWFPTHMIRTFGWSPGAVGKTLGLIQLGGSLLGAFAGAILTERLTVRGHKDAHLRTMAAGGLILAAGMIAPLLPWPTAALALWLLASIGISFYFGSLIAALQLVTPNEMRAVNSALLLLVNTLGGLAVGSAAIGAMADTLFFGRATGVGYALALLGVPCSLIAAHVAWRARGHFARTFVAGL